MKKKIFIIVCILLLFHIPIVGLAEANPRPAPIWNVQSPKNNATYAINTLNLTFAAESAYNYDYYYSLDNRVEIPIRLISKGTTWHTSTASTFRFTKELPKLNDGQHTLTLYNGYYSSFEIIGYTKFPSETITFYIDTVAPSITNLTVNSIDAGDLLLNFTVDEPASCVSYSLDNQANVTVNGDIVLKELPNGSHSLIVYASDAAGNVGASQALSFTVNNPTIDSLDLFPNITISVSIAIIAIMCVGLVFYLKKIKR